MISPVEIVLGFSCSGLSVILRMIALSVNRKTTHCWQGSVIDHETLDLSIICA